MDTKRLVQRSSMESELYFIITKFLESGPCQESAAALKKELVKHKILPKRLDWEGNEHEQSFIELEQKFPHIGPLHLLEICRRIGPLLDREITPNVKGVSSLLGVGRQSLLRTKEDVHKLWLRITEYSVRRHQCAILGPISCRNYHIVKTLHGRENSGPMVRRQVVSNNMFNRIQLYCRTLGHLSAVYCLLFDRTGKYVITGADDLLVKVWSALDGRLLTTLRGASAEISDIAVNLENTLLAAGSIDRMIRVWCLQSAVPVAILTAHTGMITGVNFCPALINGKHYLASTSSDGSVAFWSYTSTLGKGVTFQPKAVQFSERQRPGQAQMICASFSSGGIFLAAGSTDHRVRVYKMTGPEGPHRVLEVEPHTDRVDSIQWANSSLRFVSGSKDGTAIIWCYSRQKWTPKHLCMTTKLKKSTESGEEEEDSKTKVRVTMVSWSSKDQWIITACSDYSLKVWDSYAGILVQILSGHKDEVFVLEGHPLDSRVFLSAGHDGMILLWDITTGKQITYYHNNIENQGHGAVFDAKWSPDGSMMAATDSHGQILMFGLGYIPNKFLQLPKEMFFHTDYRPLVRDANHQVLDEQTQIAPHLMPPPFLVDIDGNPYPPYLQRLVPGRENCRTDQLVPNIVLREGGNLEVIEGLNEPRSNIDLIILQLQGRGHDLQVSPSRQHTSPRSRTARRHGDVEGVRQSSGNWQRDEINWTQSQLVRPVDKATLKASRQNIHFLGQLEENEYAKESQRAMEVVVADPSPKQLAKKSRKKHTHSYRTRAAREEELQDQFEDPDNIGLTVTGSENSSDSDLTARSEDLASITSSSESGSSEYSDWIADHGVNLEPPKRNRRRRQPKPPPPKISIKKSQQSEQPQEVPECYRPSEWLSAVIPKKFPYYPQMGDEAMFFRQGYDLYLEAVRHRKVYELVPTQITPWGKMMIKEPELVKVIGIKYELRPPRLCCLRLAVMRRNGKLTGDRFTIKYHDVPDVIDFLVLRQMYETAVERSWEVGDRFRSMIDDCWWWGRIEIIRNSLSEFLKYRIIWDNGETEHMSPWDMEPILPHTEPVEVGGSIPVMPDEIAAILYHPRPDEWPAGDRDAACDRIIQGLEQVMELSIAEPFIAPVDINRYPSYAMVVEYPIDLSTIKGRFENRFYRRVTAAQFDVRYLATNTEKFNEVHSPIVKQARIVTDLCLKIIKEVNPVDVSAMYRQLMYAYQSSETEEEVDIEGPGPSSGRRHKAAIARSMRAARRVTLRRSTAARPFDWKRECRELLELLWACRDSEPFREPVDRLAHPDYDQVVTTPMDFRTIREELRGDNYETPIEFCKDVRRIFINSKNYTPDKKSRIYTMTVRLSALAEDHMKRLLNAWRGTFQKREKKCIIEKIGSVRKKQRKRPKTFDNEDTSSNSDEKQTRLRNNVTKKQKQIPKKKESSEEEVEEEGGEVDEEGEEVEEEGEEVEDEEEEGVEEEEKATCSRIHHKFPNSKTNSTVMNGHAKPSNFARKTFINKTKVEEEVEDDVEEKEDEDENNESAVEKTEESDEENESDTPVRGKKRVTISESARGKKRPKSQSSSSDSYRPSFSTPVRVRRPRRSTKRKNYAAMVASDSEREDKREKSSRGRPRRGQRQQYKEKSEDESSEKKNSSDSSEDDTDNVNDNDNDRTRDFTVSSRGRIRKLTPRARAFLMD